MIVLSDFSDFLTHKNLCKIKEVCVFFILYISMKLSRLEQCFVKKAKIPLYMFYRKNVSTWVHPLFSKRFFVTF